MSREKFSYRKIGSFKIVHDGAAIEIDLRALSKVSDGLPQLKDGKLQLRATNKEYNVSVDGSDKEKLVADVVADFAKRGRVNWSKWLEIWVHRNDEISTDSLGASFSFSYEPIERANIGTAKEMKRQPGREGIGYTGRVTGVEHGRLKAGLGRETNYYNKRTKPNPDRLTLLVEDTPERRAALDAMIAKVRSLHDRVVEICGKKGENADRFLAAVSSSNLLPGQVQGETPPLGLR